ncbi:DUF397 domain-containing protein [Streptomyces sp. B93]|uniref:DUF397 domain-containing protein n=1 Tax=Streptomyces sp. B93 TaxID=2824875 RepID=UPI001B393C34|nr:DUF397 domain-containing protein [Streptomyces sp. B93]MBQ1090297.1 DUF397 domain-containing protein [Streptomyces sp. B93]
MRIVGLRETSWRKSSHSNQDGGACLEVSDGFAAVVPVRDSKRPHGPVIAFGADEWRVFVGALKEGGFTAASSAA